MVKKIIILCLITNIALANLIQFQPNAPIQANQLNSNFNHIKNILQSRNVPVNFSTFSSGQLILNQSLENEFDKVRNLNISVSPLDLVQIKSAELNNAFNQMEAGATVVDDIPSTSSSSFSINEDSQYVGVLSYVNQTGTSNIIVVSPPSNGNLAIGSNGSFTYSPNLNYNGNDSFSFKVNDGNNDSNTSIVSIIVNPVNDQPVAIAQSLITNEDTALNITISGTDVENSSLSYIILSQPSNGILSGTGSSKIYTPSSNFNGTDSFTFKVNDGQLDSVIQTISITVSPINDVPVTLSSSFTTNEDANYSGTLSASDLDNNPITYSIVSQGTKGTVTITNTSTGSFTYVPQTNQNGTDFFTFRVNDGTINSNTSTVSVTITPINDIPTAIAGSFTTNEDTNYFGTLSGNDIDGNTLNYSIENQASKGVVSITNANTGAFTYIPQSNINGSDSFTFRVNDGIVNSTTATVSITINPINDIPEAMAQSLSTNEDTALNITLSGTDLDNNPLTYAIVSQPANGILSGSGANRIYTPSSNFNGTDSFTFKVNDGVIDSVTQTVNITVNSINDAPVVSNLTGTTPEDTAFSINLSATDPDSSSFTYSIVSQATSGTASIVGNTLTYVPSLNTSGNFVVTYRANDGQVNSNNATLTITVSAVWPTGTDGALNITSGTTTLAAGSVRNYSSINIAAGATLNISGSSNAITIIGSSGPVVINGNITVTNTALGTSTATATTPDGRSLSYTQTRMPGGSGGTGGTWGTATCQIGRAGGSQSNGRGGGGGGGAASSTCASNPAVGSSTNNDILLSNGGTGGTGGDGGPGAGGSGGGNNGGVGGHGSGRGGGGGGGGGYVGRHGLSIFIKSKSNINGTGLINLSGLNGFNGGNGGITNATGNPPTQGGGGGGGGSGGSGGNLWVVSPIFTVPYNINGGNGGAGGNGGSNGNCLNGQSCAGSPGSAGAAGVASIITYP